MKQTVVFLALAFLVIGLSGCSCCRGLCAKKSKPVATPVYARCAPVCAPTCAPGGAVSYGYGGTPAMVTMPQMYQQLPMVDPSSDCDCVQ